MAWKWNRRRRRVHADHRHYNWTTIVMEFPSETKFFCLIYPSSTLLFLHKQCPNLCTHSHIHSHSGGTTYKFAQGYMSIPHILCVSLIFSAVKKFHHRGRDNKEWNYRVHIIWARNEKCSREERERERKRTLGRDQRHGVSLLVHGYNFVPSTCA